MPSSEPSVKFYRTIAVSFLILTLVLLGVVIFFASKKATIVVVAKSDNKNLNLSVDVNKKGALEASLKGIITSTQFVWSEEYFPTANKTKDGVATGEVILYNDSATAQPLVATTRLLSDKEILFRLTEGTVVPANGQVTAEVYADKAGASGDIVAGANFTIPGLSPSRQQVVYAKSDEDMTGGTVKVGILTTEDLAAAKTDYSTKAKEAFLKSFSDTLDLVPNRARIVEIETDSVTADQAVGDEIDQFNISGTSTVIIVYYSEPELQTLVGKEVTKLVDLGSEKILSVNNQPQVTLSAYDLDSSTAKLSVYQDVLLTLDANAGRLTANNFFGKNRDEIQRYVMGLNHVVGSEVNFSPSWMGTAPRNPDKIKVIVKNVK